jgi:lipopolysaccharide transport system ATP-binding protein
MSDVAIHVEALSKRYHIGSKQEGYKTLRDTLTHAASAPFRAIRSKFRSSDNGSFNGNTIWALKDISFEVKRGEVVGIVGRNGAGKSTLLKVLTRITEPTEGYADIKGRVASLLEVGTGFHPELTGRDNIHLNGAILGMRRAEIDRKFDEIVAFAEVEKFIDTPVKHYSSGMYLRLAFAVAAHLEPEILLVDEVLAVGDAAFQKKCLGKMGDVAKQGRTVFLVSHNMAAITHLSDRGVWLDNGQLRACGDVEEIVGRYLSSGIQESGEVVLTDNPENAPDAEHIRPLAVRIRNSDGRIATDLDMRLPFTVEIEYRILRQVSNLRVGLTLTGHEGAILLSSNDMDDIKGELERQPGTYVNRCEIPGNFLNYGHYFVSIGSDLPMIKANFYYDRVLAFHIEQTGGVGGHVLDRRQGMLRLSLPWDIQKIE